jgi:hypothetical protein
MLLITLYTNAGRFHIILWCTEMDFTNYQNVCVFVISDRVCYGQWLVDTAGSAAAGWRGLVLSTGCMLWMQFWAVFL